MIRTFIAFDTSPSVKNEIIRLQNILREADADVRWEQEEKLHVTLKFLGDIEEKFLPQLTATLETVTNKFSPFEIEYTTIGCFPNTKEPRVIWVGCRDVPQSVIRLQREIETQLAPFGYEIEKRKFSPHITFGRIKGIKNIFHLLQSIENLTFSPQKMQCAEILLMKSVLHSYGSIYSPLKVFPLHSIV
ncbi:MAG: RNA 2',3'-cyclic phosphodiesterase [Ignavibacteriales bacterium]|nr:RNA 2',3'-cyclic phosphodiesterase [Ignavibacteriales bacterium]